MKNWITTLVGALGAGLIALVPYLQTGEFSTQSLITAFIVAALGVASKDFNKTGV